MKKKVLIIEDDPAISDYAVLVLKKRDFEVEKASDGYSGVEAAKTFRPDVVVLDLMMPGMHGYEVCETLKKDKNLNGIKILITSSKSYSAFLAAGRGPAATVAIAVSALTAPASAVIPALFKNALRFSPCDMGRPPRPL